MSDKSSLLIVIVNYRLAGNVCECLESVFKETEDLNKTSVVVVDNASNDGSVEILKSFVKERGRTHRVKLIVADHNGGYACGNNVAIREALARQDVPDYFYLLNPDTVLRHGAITAFLDLMQTCPHAGIAGSVLESEDGVQRISTRRFPTVVREFERAAGLELAKRLRPDRSASRSTNDAIRTDWVPGASFFIRSDVFEQIGLLDERFFLYFEETDLCLRASRAGWTCWIAANSHVVHYPGTSSGVTRLGKPEIRMPAYWFESRQWYFVKNYGWLYASCADVAWALGRVFRTLRRRSVNSDPPYFVRDFLATCTFVTLATRALRKFRGLLSAVER